MDDFFKNFLRDFDDTSVIDDVVEFRLGYIPYLIKRISDGSLLYLNKDNVTYSFYESESSGNQYTWGRLFEDHRCHGEFEAICWVEIENIELMRKILEDGRGKIE